MRPQDTRLAPGELQILQLLARGLSNTEIGLEVRAAEKTVKNRLSMIYAKMGVADRLQAVLMALDLGIVGR